MRLLALPIDQGYAGGAQLCGNGTDKADGAYQQGHAQNKEHPFV